MPTTLPHSHREPDIGALAAGFGRRPDISARSVIVTIFGDSIVPAGGRIWLGDLIQLCQPFGFNDRLVRTSMSRLTAEGWFDTQRVGRRSRYSLTPPAVEEFAEAEARIYHLPEVTWDGRWTLVLLDSPLLDRQASEALRATLGWHGYAPLSPGVMAIPRCEPDQAERLATRAGVIGPVPVATAELHDLASLVEEGWLADALGLGTAADRYAEFVSRYRWLAELDEPDLTGADAFSLRTMLVHDLRRPRLADPDLPAELLPAGWPAPTALALAAGAYRQLTAPSERWLATVAGLHTIDPPAVPSRFA